MTSTVIKGKIVRSDLAVYDGIEARVSRRDSTGGNILSPPLNDFVDVLQAYGEGNSFAGNTIEQATVKIGSRNRTLRFSPGTWEIESSLTIGSNFTCYIPAGCVFNVASGKTLTFSGPIIRESETWTSGSGTVTYTASNNTLTHSVDLADTALAARGDALIGVKRTESGAIARTQHIKNLESLLSVKDFGAIGDGTTDDTAAIQSAANVGGRIFFPRGTYKLTGVVTLSVGAILFGEGEGTEILQSSTTLDAFNITATGQVGFYDLAIFQAASSTNGSAIRVSGTGVTQTDRVNVNNVFFRDNFYGITVVQCAEIKIIGCEFKNCQSRSINHLDSIAGGAKIIGNHIATGFAGTLTAIYVEKPAGLCIAGNSIGGHQRGIHFAVSHSGASTVSITGNIIEDQTNECIYFNQAVAAKTLGSVVISSNEMANPGVAGFSLDTTGTWAENISIIGNTIANAPDGILLSGGRKIMISGNQIDGGTRGINVGTGATLVQIGPNDITSPAAYGGAFTTPVLLSLSPSQTFAQLSAMQNGSMVYCSDCNIANPCTSGGTGAVAKRIAGAWVCN